MKKFSVVLVLAVIVCSIFYVSFPAVSTAGKFPLMEVSSQQNVGTTYIISLPIVT